MQTLNAQLLKEKYFNPTIKKVTVYFSAAQVFRSGSINLDKGTNTILVKNVHGSLIKNRINVQANSKVRVLQIDYSTDILQMEKTKDSIKLKSFQDTIVQIDKDLRKIKYQVSVLQTEKKMIESNSTISTSGNNLAFSQSNELQKLSAIYSTRYAEINKLLFNLNEDEINQLSKKDNYQKKINAYKLEEQKNNMPYITITLNAEESMLADLEINYLINDAAWKPKYTLAVDDVTNEMTLNYDALIKNTSGDNWNNVALSLSTSDPITSSSLPTLKPWVINKYTANMNEGYFNNSGAKNFMFNDAPAEVAKLEDKKVNTSEEISVPEMVMDFTISGQSDILSGTKPSLVNISRNKLNATYDYFTIPKIEK